MKDDREILIIGAGSTGLSSALFLSEEGLKPRILEKRDPSKITKALGVNPNTLKLLESTGITSRFLENGRKVHAMNIWCKEKLVYKNDFSKVKHEYPYMLIQPQFETEGIIEEALAEKDIIVERGWELKAIQTNNEKTILDFRKRDGSVNTLIHDDIVIGADGSNSKVRDCLKIPFKGWEHQEEFRLYDIELDTPINSMEGHYFFYKEGGMIMLHIRDGIWRVGGNIKDTLNYLPKGTRTGKISWDTTFTIKEKVTQQFSSDNVYILGDAAHIHSPAGAKGMNMCIEDSYIFAKLLKEGREREYHGFRYPQIKSAVGMLAQLTDKIGGNNIIGRTIRNHMDKFTPLFPLIMPSVRKFLLGIK